MTGWEILVNEFVTLQENVEKASTKLDKKLDKIDKQMDSLTLAVEEWEERRERLYALEDKLRERGIELW